MRVGRVPWAELLRRVFAPDVLSCPCGGRRGVEGAPEPRLFVLPAYAEFDAVSPNDSESGREQNRRIKIILVPNLEELPSLTGD